MAADSVTVSPTYNGDTVSLTAGMIVRLKPGANNNVVRAQADSAPHVQGVNGVVVSGASAPTGAVIVVCIGRETVQMENGLTPGVGDTVFVSATVAGKGTNVPPGTAFVIGTIADTTNYARLNTVEVDVALGSGVSGGSSVPLDPSGMPAANLFAYNGPNGVGLPTDNIVARASNAIALWTGNSFVTSGIQTVAMTAAGGKPARNAPIYLAASSDDNSTGIGKGTAARPSYTVPLLTYPDSNWPENATLVGTCVDNSNYDSKGTAQVLLHLPGTISSASLPSAALPAEGVLPADVVFLGANAAPFSLTQNFTADGNQDQLTLEIGKTLLVVFSCTDFTKATGFDVLLSQLPPAGSGGYALSMQAGNFLHVGVSGTSNTDLQLAAPGLGMNCVAVTVSSDGAHGTLHASLNGANVVSLALAAATVSPGAGWTFSLGAILGAGAFALGAIYACGMLNRTATVDELVAWSTVQPAPPANRFFLASAFTSSQSLLWAWNASEWITTAPPVADAGPLGTSFAFTSHPSLGGGPQRNPVSEQWYRSRSREVTIDSEPVFYDARGLPRGDPGARIAFTIPATQQELCVGITNQDFDNDDNGFAAVFCDGTILGAVAEQASTTGAVQYTWFRLPQPTAASHAIEIVTPDKQQRESTGGLFKSGTCVVEWLTAANQTYTGPATTNRLVLVGDDDTIGHDAGASSCPMGASVSTQLRLDFPGRVTVHSATARGFGIMFPLFGGNATAMDRFANEIIEAAEEGNPTAPIIYITLGFYDYHAPFATLAQFALYYAQLVDALHQKQPTWPIYAQKFIANFFDAVPNTNGETLAQFNAAVDALAIGRSWLHVVNARVPNVITFTGSNFHPDQPAGAGAWKANIKLILGY